jgi:hypothetical protein
MRALALLIPGLAVAGPATAQVPAPRLVVLVAVDQLRPDYFERFRADFTGGFRRLRDGSAFFPRGEQDHAITETAPGHATMLSGRSPASTGIVTNNLGVPDPEAPLIGLPGPGASPRRFRGTTLYDWMYAADPDVRVLSVSRKDRGAILPIGRARVPVFWYQSGYYTTSTWYGDTLPSWLLRWNSRQGPHRLAGHEWNLLLPAERYAAPDSQPWERGGYAFTFPHRLSEDTARAILDVVAVPWKDSLTLDLALEGAHQLGLGRRDRPDLLSVALSTTDAVGHVYGPDSREMHDHLVRLDRWLDWFMDSLTVLVPGNRILWVLTSDHGVQSFPEYARAHGRLAGRALGGPVALAIREELERRYREEIPFGFDNGLLYADVSRLRELGVNVDSLSDAAASQLTRITGVTMAWTPRRLARADTMDLGAMRWRRTIPADFEWLAAATLAPGYIWSYSPATTTHGTPNLDDVRVPILFMGPGIVAGTHDRRIRTMDIGPTLAALLGVRPTEPVEGVVLEEVVGRRDR